MSAKTSHSQGLFEWNTSWQAAPEGVWLLVCLVAAEGPIAGSWPGKRISSSEWLVAPDGYGAQRAHANGFYIRAWAPMPSGPAEADRGPPRGPLGLGVDSG